MYCSESFPLVAFGAWMDVLEYPHVFGDFVWTGFDYLGEASIGWLGYPHEGSFYPWNHAYCGDIDICGLKRPQSYYRNILWNSGRLLSIFVKPPEPSFEENPNRRDWSKWHWQDVVDRWNWEGWENEPLEVEVYCAHEEVELLLNDKSLGRQKTSRENQWIARWTVPYVPGELKAIAYSQGEQVESWQLVTASTPARIVLSADRSTLAADGQDLSFIQVELLDDEGNRCTTEEILVEFEITGPGTLAAVGSSNPMSSESFRQPRRTTYQGRCLVVIRTTKDEGDIHLKASAEGLPPISIVVQSNKHI
jgi:beta-galactosidase